MLTEEQWSDEEIDRVLQTRVPGGSAADDWFLPHEEPRGLTNVRDVVRRMLNTALRLRPSAAPGEAQAGEAAMKERDAFEAWILRRFGEEQSGVSPMAYSWMLETWEAARQRDAQWLKEARRLTLAFGLAMSRGTDEETANTHDALDAHLARATQAASQAPAATQEQALDAKPPGNVKPDTESSAGDAVNTPEGLSLAPHFRGYANLGIGAYFVFHSDKPDDAELVISIADDESRRTLKVGDLTPPLGLVQPEQIAVRLRFDSAAALDVLENQLRSLRAEHFPESIDAARAAQGKQ